MKEYASLIVDLKKSKAYSRNDRNDIQGFIKNCTAHLNEIFASSLRFDMIFSGGDEIQGLFQSASFAYLYFRLLNMLIAPVEIRAGIGVGAWDVKIDSQSSAEQDGPAYHNARTAIDHVRGDENLLYYSKHPKDAAINTIINTGSVLFNQQSEYQRDLLLCAELMYPILNRDVPDMNRLQKLKEALIEKHRLPYYAAQKHKRAGRQLSEYISDVNVVQPVDAASMQPDQRFFITEGNIRGLATKLADIMGTSRQSIDKSLKAGNIYQIRNASIAVIRLMNDDRTGV